MNNEIIMLRNKMNISISDAKSAMQKCEGDIDVASEYVMLKSSAVARYKVENGEKRMWTDNDYVQEAKSRVEARMTLEQEEIDYRER